MWQKKAERADRPNALKSNVYHSLDERLPFSQIRSSPLTVIIAGLLHDFSISFTICELFPLTLL